MAMLFTSQRDKITSNENGVYEDNHSNEYDGVDAAYIINELLHWQDPAEKGAAPKPRNISDDFIHSLLQAAASADGVEAAQASRSSTKSRSPQQSVEVVEGDAGGETLSPDARSPDERDVSPVTQGSSSFPQQITPAQTALIEGSVRSINERESQTRSSKRRKQTSQKVRDSQDDANSGLFRNTMKKAKTKAYVETADDQALQKRMWATEKEKETQSETERDGVRSQRESSRAVAREFRAAGVQSAAALFREPSAASKTYTRPVMAALFTSFGVDAQQFVDMQAAAKEYMLDPRHPERRDCVGGRGAGAKTTENDLAKMKLFKVVGNFLVDEGWGEKCYGLEAPGAAERELKWPEMKEKIVSTITPLLRRMVTNERQRLYAAGARKAKASGQVSSEPKKHKSQRREARAPSPSPPPTSTPTIDPNSETTSVEPGSAPVSITSSRHSSVESVNDAALISATSSEQPKFLLNFMMGKSRVKPELSTVHCHKWSILLKHADAVADGLKLNVKSISVLTPTGMAVINTELQLQKAVEAVMMTEWMNGEVKCVIQTE